LTQCEYIAGLEIDYCNQQILYRNMLLLHGNILGWVLHYQSINYFIVRLRVDQLPN